MPSVQLGGAHRPALQTPVMQALPVRQTAPIWQRAQSAAPQAMSDSGPLRGASVQFAPTQMLFEQIRLTQSVVVTQRRLLAQAVHVVPPQSMSVSSPSTFPSLHEMQVPFTQRALRQSRAAVQRRPSTQALHVD